MNTSFRDEIQNLYQKLIDAWNKRDAQEMAEQFAEQGVQIGFDGSKVIGKRELSGVGVGMEVNGGRVEGVKVVGVRVVGRLVGRDVSDGTLDDGVVGGMVVGKMGHPEVQLQFPYVELYSVKHKI